jgi:glutamyl-tRNA synthetase
LAWWHARAKSGLVRLRFEDLDVGRCSQEHLDGARYDLEWLGLDWDGPERLQSLHVAELQAPAFELVERGLAYPCVCSRGEIQALSAPHASDVEPRYPGTCRGRFGSLQEAEQQSGRPAGVRFSSPDRERHFQDGCLGPQQMNVSREVGDFLILRRDKLPAYQLSVVVDDAAQGVTDVVRGADLLSSTARQLSLIEALGLTPPRHFHVSLVVDTTGRRLAKRARDASLAQLRRRGVDARSIVAWAAKSAGFAVPERIAATELLPHFDLLRVPNTNVVVDETTVASWLAG